jgi:hypothetical protein
LAHAAATRVTGNGHAADEDEEDDEDDDEDYDDDEGVFGAEQLFETPLDKMDSYVLFSQVVQSESSMFRAIYDQSYVVTCCLHSDLQQTHIPLLQQATAGLSQPEQQALHDVLAKAQSGGEGLTSSKSQASTSSSH